MSTCINKIPFNPSDETQNYHLQMMVIKTLKSSPESKEKFLKTMLEELLSAPFFTEYSPSNIKTKEDLKQVNEEYNQLVSAIINNIESIKQELIEDAEDESVMADEPQLYTAAGNTIFEDEWLAEFKEYMALAMPKMMGLSRVIYSDLDTMSNEELEEKLSEIQDIETHLTSTNGIKLNTFNKNLFAGHTGMMEKVISIFKGDIFTMVGCDLDRGKKISRDLDLNASIRNLKNKYFADIASYLGRKDVTMFTNAGQLTPEYVDILLEFEELNKYYQDNTYEYKSAINSGFNKLIQNSDTPFIKAVTAYSILRQFDNYIKETIGNTIAISKNFFGTEVSYNPRDTSTYKYIFSKDRSHHRQNWSDSDSKTAAQNTSKISTLAIEHIPLYVNNVNTGRHLSVQQLNVTMGKLFSNTASLQSENTKNIHSLVQLLNKMHSEPLSVFPQILKAIVEDVHGEKYIISQAAGLNDVDRGVLDSLYRVVFNYDTNAYRFAYNALKSKTIKNIELSELSYTPNPASTLLITDIVNVINNSMDMTYQQTTYNSDGEATIEIRDKVKDRKVSEKFKDNVNATVANLTINQRTAWSSQMQKDEKSFTITFANSNSFTCTPHQLYEYGLLQQKGFVNTNFVYAVNSNDINQTYSKDFIKSIFDKTSRDRLDFSNETIINDILSSPRDDEDIRVTIARDLLAFIDSRLSTEFLKDNMQLFSTLIDMNNSEIIFDLLLYALKAQEVNEVYLEYENYLSSNQNYDTLSLLSFVTRTGDTNNENEVLRRNGVFYGITPEIQKTYFINNEGVITLRTIPSSTLWVDKYAEALDIITGEESASVSKNQEGSNEANYSTSFLGGQVQNLLAEVRSRGENSAASSLMFVRTPEAIKKTVIEADTKNQETEVQKSTQFLNASLFYNAIVHKFYGGVVNEGMRQRHDKQTDRNVVTIQATTFSDKVKLVNHSIDLRVLFRNSSTFLDIWDITPDMITDKYIESVGKMYYKVYENTLSMYRKLFGFSEDASLIEIKSALEQYSVESLNTLASSKGIKLVEEVHYRKRNGKLVLNEAMIYNAQMYYNYSKDGINNKSEYNEFFEEMKRAFIADLKESGLNFYCWYPEELNTTKNRSIKKSGPSLISKSKHPIAKIIRSICRNDADMISIYYDDWITDGILDTHKVNGVGTIVLNPILERFFYFESLLSSNMRLLLTGTELNHPDKSKYAKYLNLSLKEAGLTNSGISEIYSAKALTSGKIIWGQSGLGKSTYIESYPYSKVFDWDDMFNELRDIIITKYFELKNLPFNKEEVLKNLESYLKEKYSHSQNPIYSKEVIKDMDLYEELEKTITEIFTNSKNGVFLRTHIGGEKFVGSPAYLLYMFPESFDTIVTIPQDVAKERYKAIGMSEESTLNLISNLEGAVNFAKDKRIHTLPDSLKKIVESKYLMSDMVALENLELTDMLLSGNADVRHLGINLTKKIDCAAMGTQLKRNVVIPATMKYIYNGSLQGIAGEARVSVIEDQRAPVFNFKDNDGYIDAMDGAGWTPSVQSILENNSMGSDAPGVDKKPLWHGYNHETGSAEIIKSAFFIIDNERMKMSDNSSLRLRHIFKKSQHLRWNGIFDLTQTIDFSQSHKNPDGTTTIVKRNIELYRDILGYKPLFYYTYNDEGNKEYRLIHNFGKNKEGIYYTDEWVVNEYGERILSIPLIRNLHQFDINGEKTTDNAEVDHTIDSMYELWLALGGLSSIELNKNKEFQDSESSHYALAGFTNAVMEFKDGGDLYDMSQVSFYQPLKESFIGYIVNHSAMKAGASNLNPTESFYNDSPLNDFRMDTRFLGIQMDAEHDVETKGLMKEFSQVISALASGGNVHLSTRFTYQNLAKVARIEAQMELNAVARFLAEKDINYEEAKNNLYDIVGRTILNNLSSSNDTTNLTNDLLLSIEKHFNENFEHKNDKLKIAFSDPNIYSQILPVVASILNQKSIKREFPGSGMVMVPAYNMMQYFEIDGQKLMRGDVLRQALMALQDGIIQKVEFNGNVQEYENRLVKAFLEYKQKDEKLIINDINSINPFDDVDILIQTKGGQLLEYPATLDKIEDFYAFKDRDFDRFLPSNLKGITPYIIRYNVTRGKNLKPIIATFSLNEDGTDKRNIYDIPSIRQNIEGSRSAQLKQDIAQKVMLELYLGFYVNDEGQKVPIYNLHLTEAEQIVSNMYSGTFGVGNKSVAEIEATGVNAFKLEYSSPDSRDTDISFITSNGEDVYIGFQEESSSGNVVADKFKSAQTILVKENSLIEGLGLELNAYYISKNNKRLFLIGQYIKITQDEYAKLSERQKKQVKKFDNVYYKLVEFISQYTLINTDVTDNQLRQVPRRKYTINVEAIARAYNVGVGNDIVKLKVAELINSLYGLNSYLGVGIPETLSYTQAKNIFTYVPLIKQLPIEFKNSIFDTVVEKEITNYLNRKKLNPLELKDILPERYELYFNSIAQSRYSSWKMALNYTAARIPSQGPQSFMKAHTVGYSGNTRNIAYVTHFQTYLQGSDYDIDKVYLMGLVIGQDGKLVRFSDLFDYTSPNTLQASLKIPVPRELKVMAHPTEEDNNIIETLLTVQALNDSDVESDRILRIQLLSELITNLYNEQDRTNPNSSALNISYNSNKYSSEEVNTLLDILRTHENTVIPEFMKGDSYKNSISASIQNTILDIRNLNLAYSPISMDDLKKPITSTPKTLYMNMTNPLTKYLMLAENMVGRKVIGITAVAEKVFYTLTNYYNDGIMFGDESYMRNLKFHHTFTRIQDRFKQYTNSKNGKYSGNIVRVDKTCLSGANFKLNPERLLEFTLGLSSKTTEEINQAIDTQLSLFTNLEGLSENEVNQIKNFYKQNPDLYADLMISQIMSAATDNAKELILAKINAGEAFAKCHLYLLMLGFDIKDVVAFMTSPAVNLVSNLMSSNFLDPYNSKVRVQDAIDLALGKVKTEMYIQGTSYERNEDGVSQEFANHKIFNNYLKSHLRSMNTDMGDLDPILYYIFTSINNKLHPDNPQPLPNIDNVYRVKSSSLQLQYKLFLRYLNNLIDNMSTYVGQYENVEDFFEDLKELQKVNEYAEETSNLGGVFLGLNQGLPSSDIDLRKKLRSIENIVVTREKIMQMNKYDLSSVNSKYVTLEDNETQIDRLVNNIIENNKLLVSDRVHIELTLKLANAFGILGNFDVNKWLLDALLSGDDIINKKFLGKELSPDDLGLNGTRISYRNLVSDYYNLIKGTWNVFDVVNRVPQYKAIIDLLSSLNQIHLVSSIKSRLYDKIFSDIAITTPFINEMQTRQVNNIVEDIIITSFFNSRAFNFPIPPDSYIIDSYYMNVKADPQQEYINLGTDTGRAAFKKIFEELMLVLKETGLIWSGKDNGFISIPNFRSNGFLLGLRIVRDKKEIPILSMKLDLLKAASSSATQLEFQGYLNGLQDLQGYMLGDMKLTDWIILYNLYVNKNKWGSDKLTTLLRGDLLQNSIFSSYFKYLGNLDYGDFNEKVQRNMLYNIEDVLISIAPYVPKSQVKNSYSQFIKTRNEKGDYVYMRRTYKSNKGDYVEFSTFPTKSILDSSMSLREEQKANYQLYLMIPMKYLNSSNAIRAGLLDKNVNVVTKSLRKLVEQGLIISINAECK